MAVRRPASAASRVRAEMDAPGFAELLRPFCEAGPTLVVYDEAAKVGDAKTDQGLIQKAHPLLERLYEASPSLKFVRSIVSDGLALLVAEFHQAWQLDTRHHED